jgi:2-oxoglutarate ferredoxin oxidoreductase subunit gamma
MERAIVIDGVGGQGVRVIGNTMATLLGHLGYQVTLLYDYDSSVRGGMSEAFLRYGEDPVANPVVEHADVTLRLADRGPNHLQSRYVVCDVGLAREGENAEEIPFLELGVKLFGRDLFGNMIALGRLLRLSGVALDEQVLAASLPAKWRDQNMAAVRYGYDLTPAAIRRIVPEDAAAEFAARYAAQVLAGAAPKDAILLAGATGATGAAGAASTAMAAGAPAPAAGSTRA